MGLVRDALEAIVRIDKNLALLTKAQGMIPASTDRPTKYGRKLAEQEVSAFFRVTHERDFCYPDSLTLGGRLRAVRMFAGLNQCEFANELGVSSAHISKLEADVAMPSAMLIRAISRRWNIDEQWLSTGVRTPVDRTAAQTAEEKIRRILPQHVGIDWGDPNGSFTVIAEPSAEQALCDSISQRLRLAGEEAGSNRQGRVRYSRYPSRCTQATSEQQKS